MPDESSICSHFPDHFYGALATLSYTLLSSYSSMLNTHHPFHCYGEFLMSLTDSLIPRFKSLAQSLDHFTRLLAIIVSLNITLGLGALLVLILTWAPPGGL